jgi:uncharacterized protein YbaR (Trm112 family)
VTPWLLQLLCDPVDQSALRLDSPVHNSAGSITDGELALATGRRYPVRNGVPRFVPGDDSKSQTVRAFGEEWNYFDFDLFRRPQPIGCALRLQK